jgi:hypothetical protein
MDNMELTLSKIKITSLRILYCAETALVKKRNEAFLSRMLLSELWIRRGPTSRGCWLSWTRPRSSTPWLSGHICHYYGKKLFSLFFALMANMHSHTVSERIDNVKMAYFRKSQTVQ